MRRFIVGFTLRVGNSSSLGATRSLVPNATSKLCLHNQYRNFGIADRIMNYATDKMTSTREEKFKDMIDTMIKTPDWNLKVWGEVMDKQMSGWMMYIPGAKNSSEVKELETFKAILSKMSQAELTGSTHNLKGPDRERLAAASGKSIDDVVRLITYFQQTKIVATWLQLRSSNNEPIPQNEQDMVTMQEDDPRLAEIANKIMMSRSKMRAGRGKRRMFS